VFLPLFSFNNVGSAESFKCRIRLPRASLPKVSNFDRTAADRERKFGVGGTSMRRMLLLSGALFGSIAIVTVPALLMLYGVPTSVKSDATLKCYDQSLEQRPC
jgi:hypothetical protein